MNKLKVIVLNGPPGSGKDTIASMLPLKHLEVKEPLFRQALALSCIDPDEWWNRYNDRELKELPWDKLGGLSIREFMIKISEEYVKPIFGEDFYGIEAGRSATKSEIGAVFSDGGFQEEFDTICDYIGPENVLLVRLHRDGCTFEGDSRSYLWHSNEIDVFNNGDISEPVSIILDRLSQL